MVNTLKVKIKVKKGSSYSRLNERIFDVVRLIIKNNKVSGFSIILPSDFEYAGSVCDFSGKEGDIFEGFVDVTI